MENPIRNTNTVEEMSGTIKEGKSGQNPFLIDLVVENISKYLPIKELKVCRGLNRLWREATENTFLKHCRPLNLISGKDGDYGNAPYQLSISQFMEIHCNHNYSDPHSQLLRRYRNFQLHELDEESIPEFYNFLNKIGPQMTSLELVDITVIRDLQDFVNILSCKYTPCLQKLVLTELKMITNYDQTFTAKTVHIQGKENKQLNSLNVSLYDADGDRKLIEIPWLDLLFRYPKLKSLSIDNVPMTVYEEIVVALGTIRKVDESKLKLTKLNYSRIVSALTTADKEANWKRIFDILNTSNLILEEISMDDSAGEVSSVLLEEFKATLKSLTLIRDIPQTFSLMESLKHVTVEKSSDLRLLTKVPNLSSLIFQPRYHYGIRFPEKFPKPIPIPSLTTFETVHWKKWDVSELSRLFFYMPNIKVLKMCLDNKGFWEVCHRYPSLKELTVLGKDLDDFGIVGEIGGSIGEKKNFPNITFLKELETFRMTADLKENAGLTEMSVFHGFSLMQKLTTLVITVKSELSDTAMRALHRGITNVQVNLCLRNEIWELDSDSNE